MRFIATSMLEPGMLLGRDIVSPSKSFMLKKGVELTADYISYLSEKGYLGAYIAEPGTLDIEVEEPITLETLSEGIKAVEKADIGELMSSAKKIVHDITSLNRLSIDLIDLRSFDDYTYRHSINVAIYAVAVAKYMGMSDEDLVHMAEAGICHDLGKQRIPIEIINKPDRLTDEEFAEIKRHPRYSYEMIADKYEIPSIVRQAVLCHHENENGSGYPLGKTGDELSLFAKILHAVDVYDALISRRVYKDPYTPVEAFEYIIGGKGILFNEEVVDAMRMVIPTYPIATDVHLSTGEQAVVVGHTNNPLRPIVRVLGAQQNMDLTEDIYRDILIVSSGYATSGYAGKVEGLNEQRQRSKERKQDIMIVDDSVMSLQSTSVALAPDNYNIITLQSGLAAMNYLKAKGAPDLVIMDIEMPVLDGMATVSGIREMGYNDLPVIFLTSNKERETVMKCIEMHAKDYIVKPVNPIYLRERVAIALDASLER